MKSIINTVSKDTKRDCEVAQTIKDSSKDVKNLLDRVKLGSGLETRRQACIQRVDADKLVLNKMHIFTCGPETSLRLARIIKV